MAKQLIITGQDLTLNEIENFIINQPQVIIHPDAELKIESARRLIDKWTKEDKPIYGVTTGFGEFANVKISADDIRKLQENLILSHSVGVGEPLPLFIVKLMMLLRVNALAKGYSGIRLSTLKLLVEMINHNIIPIIPSQGSVGSSGDLVQLSHLVLALIGRSDVIVTNDLFKFDESKRMPAVAAFEKFGLKKISLAAKEGLALINGTQMMTAFASYITMRAKKLIKLADVSGALSHEALRCTDRAFDERIHKLRPYKGQIETAENILSLIKGSEIRESHRYNDGKVQDAYSIRCIPQVHGASRDCIEYVSRQIEIEINCVNDNPIIFPEEEEHLEGGNFHGQPIALPMDFLAIALSELANISERRIERMVNGALSGLPRFLTKDGGLNSGMMIAQYTAASLVSENKVLSHPASVDSIPTSANQEDHNSMGSIAAQKCFRVMENLEKVLALEILTAVHAIDFLHPLKPGKGTEAAYKAVRKHVPKMHKDRLLHDDVQKIITLVKSDSILNAVESVVKLI